MYGKVPDAFGFQECIRSNGRYIAGDDDAVGISGVKQRDASFVLLAPAEYVLLEEWQVEREPVKVDSESRSPKAL